MCSSFLKCYLFKFHIGCTAVETNESEQSAISAAAQPEERKPSRNMAYTKYTVMGLSNIACICASIFTFKSPEVVHRASSMQRTTIKQ